MQGGKPIPVNQQIRDYSSRGKWSYRVRYFLTYLRRQRQEPKEKIFSSVSHIAIWNRIPEFHYTGVQTAPYYWQSFYYEASDNDSLTVSFCTKVHLSKREIHVHWYNVPCVPLDYYECLLLQLSSVPQPPIRCGGKSSHRLIFLLYFSPSRGYISFNWDPVTGQVLFNLTRWPNYVNIHIPGKSKKCACALQTNRTLHLLCQQTFLCDLMQQDAKMFI